MNRKAFTLVEILIVVIILGILAAIVIPQFSEASDDARLSSLVSDLQTVRCQLELYRVEHGSYPDGGTSALWIAQLTGKTMQDGSAWDGTPDTDYGPYLQIFPTNPFNDLADVAFGAVGDGSTGWSFDSTDGKFIANDDAAHAAL